MFQNNVQFVTKYFYEYFVIIFIAYELPSVNKTNSKHVGDS